MNVLSSLQRFLQPGMPTPSALSNGILDLPVKEFSGFRSVAAVHSDGTCFVAEGVYQHEDTFVEGLRRLRETGVITQTGSVEQRRLDEITALYRPDNGAKQDDPLDLEAKRSGRWRLLQLLEEAAEARASDFEIIDRETHTDVQIKIAGRWFPYGHPWTSDEGKNALSAAFDAQDPGSGENMAQETGFQGFSISPQEKLRLPANVIKLRCTRGHHEAKTRTASHLVARLFYNTDHETGTLADLGHDAEVLSKLAKVRADLRGAIIVAGETGDGKSTTLTRNTAQIDDDHGGHAKIVMLEDPVEYRLNRPSVTQIAMQSAGTEEERSRHYGDAFRHFLRSNPDVGIITEIRDGALGREAIKFVQSGHLFCSTLHVDSGHRIPFRLITMGVPPEELAEPGLLRLLIKQTLLPLLCDHCKRPMAEGDLSPPDRAIVDPLMEDRDRVFLRNPEGCSRCQRKTSEIGRLAWWGYQRETAVAEVIEPDETYLGFVRDKDSIGGLQHWLKPRSEGGMGGITIAQKMTELVLTGQVDPRDAVRKHGDLSQRMTAVQKADLKWGDAK
ncbi:ATPase, T2SS/T4P/T4SS family [uncultured Ruegeria sp.]|uniref:ATPase, T2SS/T4P/T4SS family n=1 Tax=uncultured Ruegeria sp. TaxID=259304 RepID=UPI00263084A1|nr:ATPase, T2SS/T4P/T4SS family [uncultured Ruegeria sp.]